MRMSSDFFLSLIIRHDSPSSGCYPVLIVIAVEVDGYAFEVDGYYPLQESANTFRPKELFPDTRFFSSSCKQRVSCCHHWPPLRQPLRSISTSAPSSSSSVDDAAEEGYSTTEEKMGGSVG